MDLVKLEEIASLAFLFGIIIIFLFFVLGRITVKLMIEYNQSTHPPIKQAIEYPHPNYDTTPSIV